MVLNIVIVVQFIVKVFTGQYKFVELEPRKINFTFWLVGFWRSLDVNMYHSIGLLGSSYYPNR